MSMPEGVPKGLHRDFVDLVANDRVQILGSPSTTTRKSNGGWSVVLAREFVAEGSDCLGQIVPFER